MDYTVIQGEVCWLAQSKVHRLAATGSTSVEAVANLGKVLDIMARLTKKRLLAELDRATPSTEGQG